MEEREKNSRDRRGRFVKTTVYSNKPDEKRESNVEIDHNYCVESVCEGSDCTKAKCDTCFRHLNASVKNDSWKEGRRLVEFNVLLSNLQFCKICRLGPVPLTCFNIVGELKKGLSGYLYVQCQNNDCGHINCVPYGTTHHQKTPGMPCFAVNTKLGTGNKLICLTLNKFYILKIRYKAIVHDMLVGYVYTLQCTMFTF